MGIEHICMFEAEDADPAIDACINPVHIDQWRECAQIDQQELRMRLATVQNQLLLVQRQARSLWRNMDNSQPRVTLRIARQYMTQAQDKLDQAMLSLRNV